MDSRFRGNDSQETKHKINADKVPGFVPASGKAGRGFFAKDRRSMGRLKTFFQNLWGTFLNLTTPQKILYAGSVLVLLGSLIYLFHTVNRTEYGPLYSGLPEEDLAAIVQSLKEKQIPYHLNSNRSVEVPVNLVYETRLALAAEGIPNHGGAGFEIFDEQKLGSTHFVQKINYQRALQGELARTINQLEEVQESRVHLAIPEESLFVEEQKYPSAAVVLKLRNGARLNPKQIQGIVHLLVNSIQGLAEDRVSILSTDGQVLFRKSQGTDSLEMNAVQMEYKNRVEENLRRKVQGMLEKVVGVNRVVTQVSVDLDFDRVQIAEESYDPDSIAVRSQQRSVEKSREESKARGNPDAPVNLESRLLEDAAPDEAQSGYERQKETINYEVNRVSKQIVQTPGSIRRLSVAMIVDGPYEMQANDQGESRPVFTGRSAEEMKALEDLVKRAVGYDEGRGDQITVSNAPFVTDPMGTGAGEPENTWLAMLKRNQKLLFNLLLTFLVFFFVIRPFMKKFQKLGESREDLESKEQAPAALPEGRSEEDAQGLLETAPKRKFVLRDQAAALVQNDPERALQIIRSWLREEG